MDTETYTDTQLHLLLDQMGAPAFVFDENLKIIGSNKPFSAHFNLSRNQATEVSVVDVIHPRFTERSLMETIRGVKDAPLKQVTFSGSIPGKILSQSGSAVTVTVQPAGFTGDLYLGIITHVSEKLDTPRPDVSDKHLFKILLNELPDAIYFKDLMGRFFLTNRLHINKLGLKNVEEFSGKTDFDLFSEEHARQAFNDEQYVIRTGKTISKEEKETYPNGTETWASTSKMPLRNENGRVVGTFGISKDITKIKNAEIQLRQAEKILQEANASKDKFFSILAHDLRNPFNSLIGLSEMLVDEYQVLSDDEKLDLLTKIQRTSQSAYALLENLLDWSRMQRDAIPLKTGNVLLDPLIDEVLEINHVHAFTKKITIEKSVPEEVAVRVDANMLRTILRNLVSNAIKFTMPGGQVFIEVKKRRDKVQIHVKDNGIGMDADTLKKLFMISEKIKTYGTADESGTGLGLIIVKEFVEKNGGTISARSTEGRGSVFKLLLPAA